MTTLRRAGNWGLTQLVRGLFGGRFSDLCYGYAAFWARVLPTLALTADGFEIETEMNLRALQAKLRVAEVASFEADRIHGESNLRTFPDGWRVAKAIARHAWRDCCSEWAGLWARGEAALGSREPAVPLAYAAGTDAPVAVQMEQAVGD